MTTLCFSLRVWITAAVTLAALHGIAAELADDIAIQCLDESSVRWSSVSNSVRGILVRPAGEGPFPAVVVSHGLGGSAANFGLSKAREFARWGMMAIAPDYTHARAESGPGGPSDDRSTFGASAENLRRARFCVAWLRARPDVDRRRIAAYGHSMGGFVTIALAAEEPLVAAAITGSGMAPREGFPAPGPEVVRKVRTPLLMIHGGADPVVRPAQSEALKRLLDELGVPNDRIVWPVWGMMWTAFEPPMSSTRFAHGSNATACYRRGSEFGPTPIDFRSPRRLTFDASGIAQPG